MKELEEMDAHTQESLRQIAALFNVNAQYVVGKWQELWLAVGETIAVVAQQSGDVFTELPDMPRPPVEIKKDIKREKNPMRLKQLNKELNDAYKSRIGRKR